jgi:pyridoxal phosphate enzyme (YggS family)
LAAPRDKIRGMGAASHQLAANLARIRERMDRAATRAGRRTEKITLVGVSKARPVEDIRAAYEAGVRHFGENRIQEWESKRTSVADLDVTWHLIGHLQSNKVARAARLFHTIDSVDSIALAEKLEGVRKELVTKQGERLPALIEVKLDPEPAKSGVSAAELPRVVEALLRLPHLELRGLMGVPPYFDDPEKTRPYFRSLRELRDAMRAQLGGEVLPVLSMGMSNDFEVAIEEGATEIRVGTALFGERKKA